MRSGSPLDALAIALAVGQDRFDMRGSDMVKIVARMSTLSLRCEDFVSPIEVTIIITV
jgi:hypothetical protein